MSPAMLWTNTRALTTDPRSCMVLPGCHLKPAAGSRRLHFKPSSKGTALAQVFFLCLSTHATNVGLPEMQFLPPPNRQSSESSYLKSVISTCMSCMCVCVCVCVCGEIICEHKTSLKLYLQPLNKDSCFTKSSPECADRKIQGTY